MCKTKNNKGFSRHITAAGFLLLVLLATGYSPILAADFNEVFKLQKRIALTETEKNLVSNVGEVDVDSKGHIWIMDASLSRLFKIDGQKGIPELMVRNGNGPSEISMPTGMVIGKNDRIYVTTFRNRVTVFDLNGKETNAFVATGGHFPTIKISVNSNGSILLGGPMRRVNKKTKKRGTEMIHLYTPEGEHIKAFCKKSDKIDKLNLGVYQNIAFDLDKDDNVYSVQPMDYRVSVFDKDGNFKKSFGQPNKFYVAPGLLRDEVYQEDNKLKAFERSFTFVLDVCVYEDMIFVISRKHTDATSILFNYYIDIYDRNDGKVIHSGIETPLRLHSIKKGSYYFADIRLSGDDEQKVIEVYRLKK